MTRLHTQHQRLYLPATGATHEPPGDATSAADAGGGVRALVLALAGPPDWSALAAVWRGVQAELDLPAPGIAVDGERALQLWFSLAEPVTADQGEAFLQGLRRRFLPGVKPARVSCRLGVAGAADVPPAQTGPERWSAFVAPDLAAVFTEEPSLDFQPGADAQAELLSRLAVTSSAAFQSALSALEPVVDVPSCSAPPPAAVAPAPSAGHPSVEGAESRQDPRRFLLAVMNDHSVPMALRIEAAKALLPAGAG